MEKNKKPAIRFRGFSEEWEERKLGEDVADIVGGGTPNTLNPAYWNGNIDWYTPTEIGKKVYAEDSEKKITELGLQKSSARILPAHKTVLFTSRAGIGDMAILQHLGTTNQGFQSLIIKDGYNTYFIYSIGHLIKKYALKNASGSTFLEISGKKLGKMELMCPSFNEQTKIGAFFSNLDHIITLHQHKYDKLQNFKKSMIEKMFPQNGSSVPEIRFKGFTEDWEQCKLGDLLAGMYNGQTPYRLNEDNWNGNINWLSSGELNRGVVIKTVEKITSQGKKNANLKLIPKNTFVIAITGLEARGTRGNCAILGIDSTINQSCMALFPIKELLDSKFLFQWYRKVGEEYGISYTQGTKQQSYNAEIIKLLPISVPSLEEQNKIAQFLFNLDHLITLHKHKLEKLQNIKKACLEKMFV